MEIDRAIEILEDWLRGDDPDFSPDLQDAIRQAIEALKEIEE